MPRSVVALSAGIAVAALGLSSASAADLAPVEQPAYAVAPAPGPFTWEGFYVGAQAGWGWAGMRANQRDIRAMFNGGVTNSAGQHAADGFVGGGTAGFNYQTGNLVLGVEGDFSGSAVDGTFNGTGTVVGPPATNYAVRLQAHMNWYATARARAGYAAGRFLIFGTGGLAVAQIDGSYRASNPAIGTFTASASNTHLGWAAGGGAEYALTDRLSTKLDFLYLGLDQRRYNNVRFSGSVAVTRAGLNYRF